MSSIQPITKGEFREKSWKIKENYFFAKEQLLCQLGVEELSKAVMGMPIAFIPDDDHYTIAAVMGIKNGFNVFLSSSGGWMGKYIPAALRGYPFTLAGNKSNENEQILCIDTDSGLLVNDNTEVPFFDENLEPSEQITEIMNFLSYTKTNYNVSNRICKSLSEYGLLKPWEFNVEVDDKSYKMEGLFCVNEAAFDELPNDAYVELRAIGAIPVIYCQLLSMQRVDDLILRHKLSLRGENGIKDKALQITTELNLGELDTGGNISFENL